LFVHSKLDSNLPPARVGMDAVVDLPSVRIETAGGEQRSAVLALGIGFAMNLPFVLFARLAELVGVPFIMSVASSANRHSNR